ncbi:MAG TPA: mechanosensitive ion channel family protein [bacterium]|nr:mechanosensitive ion channel family protein [bacterium]HOL47840.1 mechanosensitive ion channel family protein [bacterium]HPQ19553.1 mechanosensitive ion channel family protein [bacterium]
MAKFLFKSIYNNTIYDYLVSFAIFLSLILLIKVVELYIIKYLKRLAQKTETEFDDFLIVVIEKVLTPMSYFLSFFFALKILNFSSKIHKILEIYLLTVFTIYVVKFLNNLIQFGLMQYAKKHKADELLERSLKGIVNVSKVIIWSGAIIFYFDNIGFKISTIIAGLGIGGIAVAMAAQSVLKDLFSYFCILFDRPFKVGDLIIIGDFSGTVEYIGIKTTRIRSVNGEQIIMSNIDLTDSRLRNYKNMTERRALFRFGVTYQTSLEKLKEISDIVKNIIENIPDTRFDRVHFISFGDFSLLFEVVYFVLSADYKKYADIQQSINLKLKEELEKRQIEFAYPTQTIYIGNHEKIK